MATDDTANKGITRCPNSGTAATREYKKLWDVVSADEFTELMARCKAAAQQRGGWFIYDEATHLMGERTQAAYIRALAGAVQMNDLAQRLDPEDFAPSAFEQMQGEWLKDGRSNALRNAQLN